METIGSMYKKIEVLANVMTIVVAALISVALVKAYFIPAPPAVTARTMSGEAGVGTSLEGRLPDVDWGRNERTLLVAISTQCHFCKESTPFYRKLQEQIGKRLKIVAVLPQPTTAAEQFLVQRRHTFRRRETNYTWGNWRPRDPYDAAGRQIRGCYEDVDGKAPTRSGRASPDLSQERIASCFDH